MASYLDGTNDPADNVVPIALARLEKMIESRLGEVLDDSTAPVVHVKVLESTDYDPTLSGEMPIEPDQFDGIVDSILSSLRQAVQAEIATDDQDGDVIHLQAYHTKEPTSVPSNCDFIAGRMRCMSCGSVSRADESTRCETFLRENPRSELLAVGSHIGRVIETARPDYYAAPRDTQPDEDIHVLEGWECSQCQGVNWAEIVIADEHIKSIWSVTLNQDVLGRAHLISSESVELAAELTGRPPWTLLDEDILSILFERL